MAKEIRYIKKDINNYLKGKLVAKYVAKIDADTTWSNRLQIFNLELLKAEVEIREQEIQQRAPALEQENPFEFIRPFPTKLPTDTVYKVIFKNGSVEYFDLNLMDVRLVRYEIKDRIIDGDYSYGSLECEITGYFVSEEIVKIEVDVPDEKSKEDGGGTGGGGTGGGGTGGGGTWEIDIKGGLEIILQALLFLLALLILVPIIVYGYPILLLLGVLLALDYLFNQVPITPIVSNVFRWFWNIIIGFLCLCLIAGFGFGLYSFIRSGFTVPKPTPIVEDTEKSTIIPMPQPIVDTFRVDTAKLQVDSMIVPKDSLIVHYRTWRGYKREQYAGYLGVKLSDMRASGINKSSINLELNDRQAFATIYNSLDKFDKVKLEYVYATFDSIRRSNQLDRMEFAEMVVSCIQDIPYTLVLEGECNPWRYNNSFIREYLVNGGKCRAYERFGVLSPTEFVGTLAGDCDTRSLLLYTILDHFEYKVALFVSDFFKHAVLGVELPYLGTSKTYNNVRYVLWETTAVVFPGELVFGPPKR